MRNIASGKCDVSSVKLHKFHIGLCSCRMAAVAPSLWSSGQRNKTQLQKPQFDPQEARTLPHCPLLATNDGRGGILN